jgi:hypothetical protein
VSRLPDSFRNLFWNYRFESIDADRAAGMVIRTGLAYGTWEQVEWLFAHYGWDGVRQAFLVDYHGCRELPLPTRRLWAWVFLGEVPGPEPDVADRWRPRRSVPTQG